MSIKSKTEWVPLLGEIKPKKGDSRQAVVQYNICPVHNRPIMQCQRGVCWGKENGRDNR